jgi:hypothetical protein
VDITHERKADAGDELAVLQAVLTETEGQILCDLLNSGSIDAMLRSTQFGGYGILTSASHGGAGEVLVHKRDLAEARNFVQMWQAPLLEEEHERK